VVSGISGKKEYKESLNWNYSYQRLRKKTSMHSTSYP